MNHKIIAYKRSRFQLEQPSANLDGQPSSHTRPRLGEAAPSVEAAPSAEADATRPNSPNSPTRPSTTTCFDSPVRITSGLAGSSDIVGSPMLSSFTLTALTETELAETELTTINTRLKNPSNTCFDPNNFVFRVKEKLGQKNNKNLFYSYDKRCNPSPNHTESWPRQTSISGCSNTCAFQVLNECHVSAEGDPHATISDAEHRATIIHNHLPTTHITKVTTDASNSMHFFKELQRHKSQGAHIILRVYLHEPHETEDIAAHVCLFNELRDNQIKLIDPTMGVSSIHLENSKYLVSTPEDLECSTQIFQAEIIYDKPNDTSRASLTDGTNKGVGDVLTFETLRPSILEHR